MGSPQLKSKSLTHKHIYLYIERDIYVILKDAPGISVYKTSFNTCVSEQVSPYCGGGSSNLQTCIGNLYMYISPLSLLGLKSAHNT